MSWHLQVRKAPSAYGVSGHGLSEQAVEKVLKDQLILTTVKQLARHGIVSMPHLLLPHITWHNVDSTLPLEGAQTPA